MRRFLRLGKRPCKHISPYLTMRCDTKLALSRGRNCRNWGDAAVIRFKIFRLIGPDIQRVFQIAFSGGKGGPVNRFDAKLILSNTVIWLA